MLPGLYFIFVYFLDYKSFYYLSKAQWQFDNKLSALADLTLSMDSAFVKVPHFLDVSKSESKSFYIMAVACMYSIEFLEYLFQIFMLDTYAIVFDGKKDVFVIIPSGNIEINK